MLFCGDLTILLLGLAFHCFVIENRKSLCHSLGRPSRSDFVQSEFVAVAVAPKWVNTVTAASYKEKIKMAFKEVKIEELSFNPFTKISKEWMLITAGDEEKHNTMTASWGGVGIMWGMNVATAYIRPQRYTKEFVDAEDMFTLSFFKEDYRKALNLCGSKSGRDCDKDKEAGLTPYYTDGTTAYEEADLIFVCRKLYAQEMKPECFTVDGPDEKWYPGKDYHTMYMGEIVKVLVRE